MRNLVHHDATEASHRKIDEHNERNCSGSQPQDVEDSNFNMEDDDVVSLDESDEEDEEYDDEEYEDEYDEEDQTDDYMPNSAVIDPDPLPGEAPCSKQQQLDAINHFTAVLLFRPAQKTLSRTGRNTRGTHARFSRCILCMSDPFKLKKAPHTQLHNMRSHLQKQMSHTGGPTNDCSHPRNSRCILATSDPFNANVNQSVHPKTLRHHVKSGASRASHTGVPTN
jgi:hypothetical protein